MAKYCLVLFVMAFFSNQDYPPKAEGRLKSTELTPPVFTAITSNETIVLLGLFDLSRHSTGNHYEENLEGQSELTAAQIAVDHVNAAGLLEGHKIALYVNDTKCDPGVAVDTFFHAIFSKKVKAPILLGSACSEATASLANIAPYWNMVQVSHGATSPVLRDRKAFPTFFRIVASDASHNAARLAFIHHFQWHALTVISQDAKEYTLAVNDLVKLLEQGNITCRGTITFGENDFEDQLQQLKDMDTRIIIGSFSSKVAPKIFCKVFELGMYGSDYAWILPQGEGDQWWKDQALCSIHKLEAALQGAIIVGPYHSGDTTNLDFSGEELEDMLSEKGLPVGRYARESYDAVWAAAHALHRALQPAACGPPQHLCGPDLNFAQFDYSRDDIADRIFREMSNITFDGVSGPILFEGSDRVGTSIFYQLQEGKLTPVALYSPGVGELNLSCSQCQPLTWVDEHVPIAQRYIQLQVRTISTEVFIGVSVSSGLAVLLACFFLAFNLYFRKLKLIKLSSPRLNNIAVVGCIAVYLGVFLLGLDHATNPLPAIFPALCSAKVCLFAGGFSLAFGSIFAKTYRIHKIFIRSRGGFVKKKYLQDTQLILLVWGLLLIDGLVLTVWIVTDPLDWHLRNLTLQVSATDRSVIYMPQVEICTCSYLHCWLSFLYAYKGLQLVMGVYMAWETRHVKIPALNDSQYIGISVYSVVITSCIVVVLANVVADRPSVAYVTISAMILTTTTATLGLLFIPKVVTVLSRKEFSDPVMQSVGLKLESNTRRFLTDDSREKLFRLEVQNRVFKRELMLLTVEARRLERQLVMPGSSPTASSISLELTSYKVTLQESEESQHYSPTKCLTSVEPDISELSLPRRSWPSEVTGGLRLAAKVAPFRSDQNLEVESLRPKVLDRIRNLIRTKRTELRRMADPVPTAVVEPKRKFSLTMCLQAPRQKESSNKDIIIDLDLSHQQIEKIICKTRGETQKKQLLHQSSYPVIVVNLQGAGSSLKDHIAPAASLSTLQFARIEQKINAKCRSLDDSMCQARTEHRY